MKKEIKISGQPVEFNSSAGWLYIYREQFGHDILSELMPAIEAILLTITNASRSFGYVEGVKDTAAGKEVMLNITDDLVGEITATLSGLELTTAINIAWAMAKNANEEIPGPRRWVNQFETFPADEIVPELFDLVLESSVSKKNAERIRNAIGTFRESMSKDSDLTSSPSQPQIEG